MYDPDRYDVVDPTDYEYWDHSENPEGPSMDSHPSGSLTYAAGDTNVGESDSIALQDDGDDIKSYEEEIYDLQQTILNITNCDNITDSDKAMIIGLVEEQIWKKNTEIEKLNAFLAGDFGHENIEDLGAHWVREALEEKNQEVNEPKSTKQENEEGGAERSGQETEKGNAMSDDGLDEAMKEAFEDIAQKEAREKTQEIVWLRSEVENLQRIVKETDERFISLQGELAREQVYRDKTEDELRNLRRHKGPTVDTEKLKEALADALATSARTEAAAKAFRKDTEAAAIAHREETEAMAAAHRKETEETARAHSAKVKADGQAYRDRIKKDAITYGERLKAKAKANSERMEAELKELRIEQAAQAESAKAQAEKTQNLEQQLVNATAHCQEAEVELQELRQYKDQTRYIEQLQQQLVNATAYHKETEVELRELRRYKDQAESIGKREQELVDYRNTIEADLQELKSMREKKVEADKVQTEYIQKFEQKLEEEAANHKTVEAELQDLRRIRDDKVEAGKAQVENTQKLQQDLENALGYRKTTEAELQKLRGLRDEKVDADKVQVENTQKLKQEIQTLAKQLAEERARASDLENSSIAAKNSAAATKSHKQDIEKLERDKAAYKDLLTKAQQTCEGRKDELEEMTKLKEANATFIKNQEARIKTLEQIGAEKDKTILKLRNDTSAKSREQLSKEIEELLAELATVQESGEKQKSLNEEISRKSAEREQYVGRIDRALKLAEDKLATEKTDHKRTVDSLKKIEASLQVKEKELGEGNAQAVTTKRKLEDAHGQLKALNTEVKSIEDVKRDLAVIKEEKKIIEDEIVSLEKIFDDTKAEYTKLNDDFDVLKKKKEAVDSEVKARQEVDGGSTKPALENTLGKLAVPNSNLQAIERVEPKSLPMDSLQPPQPQNPELIRSISNDLASELMSVAGDESDSLDDEHVPGIPVEKRPRLMETDLAPKSGSKHPDVVSAGNKDADKVEDVIDDFVENPDLVKDWSPTGVNASTSCNESNEVQKSDPNAVKQKTSLKAASSDAFDNAHNISRENVENILSVASLRKHNEHQKAIEMEKILPAGHAIVKAGKHKSVMGGQAGKAAGPKWKTVTAGHGTPIGQAPNTPTQDKQGEPSKVGEAAKSPEAMKKSQAIDSGTTGGPTSPSSIPEAVTKTGNHNGGLAQEPTSQRSRWATSPKKSSRFTVSLPPPSSEYTIPTKWAFLIFLLWLLTMLWASTSIADAKKERNMWLAANDFTRREVISQRYGLEVGRGIFGIGTGMEVLGWFWQDSMDGLQAGRMFG